MFACRLRAVLLLAVAAAAFPAFASIPAFALENCTLGITQSSPIIIGAIDAATPDEHRGCDHGAIRSASGSPLATRGGAAIAREGADLADDALLRAGICFVAGTLVNTEAGATPIEKVKAGDLVWSRNDETGEQGWKRVKQTFVTHPIELVTLTARPVTRPRERQSTQHAGRAAASDSGEDGSDPPLAESAPADSIKITGTAVHPFWSVTRQAWIGLGELREGERLSLADGRAAIVEDLAWQTAAEGERFTTYNFEVEDWHTYFVGAPDTWIWVHNTGPTDCFVRRIRELDTDTYQRFVERSVPGDMLEGHELLQHAWLKSRGLAGERLSTAASQNNIVIALRRTPTHQMVNRLQRAVDPATETALENIARNGRILLDAGVPRRRVYRAVQRAIEHGRSLGVID